MAKKLGDATASEKMFSLYSILIMLREGQSISLSKLAQELNCSKPTVLRLINQIEATSFAKIKRTVEQRESKYAFDRPKKLPKISITAEGLQQLMMCRDFMASFLPESMRNATRATLGQVQAYLPEEENANFTSVGETYSKGRIDYTPFEKSLHTITTCMRNKQVCQISYRSSLLKEARMLEIAPLRLLVYRDAMYVRAWVVNDKGKVEAKYAAPTVFALHRIQDAIPTRRKTEHLHDVEDETGGFGLLKEPPFTVKIRFSPTVSTYVAERMWSPDQHIVVHKDASLTLTMSATSHREVIAWVLSFGKEASLLEPADLKTAIAEELAAMQSQYA